MFYNTKSYKYPWLAPPGPVAGLTAATIVSADISVTEPPNSAAGILIVCQLTVLL